MTYCSRVAVLALVGLTKKRSGHYAILKILSLRSPSNFSLHTAQSIYLLDYLILQSHVYCLFKCVPVATNIYKEMVAFHQLIKGISQTKLSKTTG